jgi:phosphate transport system substrate-binding protein
VLHPSNPVTNLTSEQVQKIFKGEITNWKDVGGADKEILVVTREEGSGTRSAFEELMKLQEKKDDKTISFIRSDALVGDGNGAIKANIASKDNAVGYLSLGFVDNSIKKVSLDGVECTVENIKNKSYAISRPFLMLTKGEVRPEVQAFLDFILGDKGQEIVGKTYITVK